MEFLKNLANTVTFFDFLDLAIMTFLIYRALQLMRGTRIFYMAVPIIAVLAALPIAQHLNLKTTYWLISNVTGYLFLMLVILFQPELRRALLIIGESRFLRQKQSTQSKMLEEIVRAATILANRQIGALMVFQRKIAVENVVTIGQRIDSEVSRDLLLSIFIPYSPLHDGAVLINGSRIQAAGCILPLTKREDIAKNYGTRHRAAIGITEETDAVTVVVSEERGEISLVAGGVIAAELDGEGLRVSLEDLLSVKRGGDEQ